jgi:hypothetical protein
MKVIVIQEEAFYALIDIVVRHVKDKLPVKEDKWISGEEAMKKLRITSKATLQKFRDEGKIRFSHPERRIILYDSESINAYLEKHARGRF